MLGWGLNLVGRVVANLPTELGIPAWVSDVVNSIACSLLRCFSCNVTSPVLDPCG